MLYILTWTELESLPETVWVPDTVHYSAGHNHIDVKSLDKLKAHFVSISPQYFHSHFLWLLALH